MTRPPRGSSRSSSRVGDPAELGRWGPLIGLLNVAVHSTVLPTGRVLMWGRRIPGDPDLDVHECQPFLFDPATGQSQLTDQPKSAGGADVNLFCAGHAFLPDGRLLVTGGHETDGGGIDQVVPVRPGREHLDGDRADEQRPLVSHRGDPARRPHPGAGRQLQAGWRQ